MDTVVTRVFVLYTAEEQGSYRRVDHDRFFSPHLSEIISFRMNLPYPITAPTQKLTFFRGAAAQCGLWPSHSRGFYEGWNFNSGNYLFTTDTK